MRSGIIMLASAAVALIMVMCACGGDGSAMAEDWSDGFEEEYVGHNFDEEMWTNDDIGYTADDGGEGSFTASYVNTDNVQAFLVAFNGVEKDNQTGVLPYQMFGMHYFTPGGEEMFIGALLASLFVFNDTNDNGYPDPGDGDNKFMYVFPYGVDTLINPGHSPKVTALPAEKLGEGHYTFGMKYENLYAIVTGNPLASAIWKTGWIAEFSELTITYDIKIDKEAGTLTAETFYTIGQVTDLWAIILGIPIHVNNTRFSTDLGLGALHYVSVFTSKYSAKNETGHDLSPAMNVSQVGKIDIGAGYKDERAFRIGFRGDFDLLDEDAGNAEVSADNTAYNILLQAKPQAVLLVGWQLAFSARIFSVFAYGLSDHIQESYSDPLDLANRSLLPSNPEGFGVQALWYAVTFPEWEGYRVEHDPTYTAYTSFEAAGVGPEPEDEESDTPGFGGAAVLAGMGATVAVMTILRGRRR